MDSINRKLPVIALDYTLWESAWMNRQHILSRLGERGWPVIYSNGAKFYHEVKDSSFLGSSEKKNHILEYKSGLFFPRNYRLKKLDSFAIQHHCRVLLDQLGLKKYSNFIVFCFNQFIFFEKKISRNQFTLGISFGR